MLEQREAGLCVEDVPAAEIAMRYGTPCYVYSRAALRHAYRTFDDAFKDLPHLVCYAVKANSNLAILNLLARLGSGFDIVSGGELARVIAAGGDPKKVVFSGVGKTDAEIVQALEAGILCFNVESGGELERIERLAAHRDTRAAISFRVNPDVDPKTHAYISTGLKESKFGVAYEEALPLYRRAQALRHIVVRGIDMHIGSQITELGPYRNAAAKLFALVDQLAAENIRLEHADLGGGLGIRYRAETVIDPVDYALAMREALGSRKLRLLFEPGRYLVGNAGLLLTRVIQLKPGRLRNFAIVDAAMNDLIRPALYEAWHDVVPVVRRDGEVRLWDIVGAVCESADFLAHGRELSLADGDLLAIRSAGAYGMVMSSNYNSRPRSCEVMVDGAATHLVRTRETVSELFARETMLR